MPDSVIPVAGLHLANAEVVPAIHHILQRKSPLRHARKRSRVDWQKPNFSDRNFHVRIQHA
jgi:hypothetical protein